MNYSASFYDCNVFVTWVKTHALIRSSCNTGCTGFNVQFPHPVVRFQRLHPVNLAAVSCQVARAGELTTADLTPVRFLSSVHSHVVAQTPHSRERSVTLGALEWFDASMGAQMGIQDSSFMVPHSTDLTAERSLPIVVQHMLVKVVAITECLGAAWTGELPRRAVSLQVHI